MNYKGLSLLIRLLRNKNSMVVYNAVWALGNLCADSIQYRNMILDVNVM